MIIVYFPILLISKRRVSYFSAGFLKIPLKSTAFFFLPVMATLLILVFFPPFSPINETTNPSSGVSSLFLRVWKKESTLKSYSGILEKTYSFDFSGSMKSVRIPVFSPNSTVSFECLRLIMAQFLAPSFSVVKK
jgi:hypothetical protein